MFDNIVSFTGEVAWNCCQIMLSVQVRNILIEMLKRQINSSLRLEWDSGGKHASEIIMLHSLYSRGDEGHADHHQVQNIEIVSTE